MGQSTHHVVLALHFGLVFVHRLDILYVIVFTPDVLPVFQCFLFVLARFLNKNYFYASAPGKSFRLFRLFHLKTVRKYKQLSN